MEKADVALGDISKRIWAVKPLDDEKEKRNGFTMKAREQLQGESCAFTLDGERYDDWKLLVMSYNDFGGEYKIKAKPNEQQQ